MATSVLATSAVSEGAVVMNEPRQLRSELEELVRDLLALKAMARDGILTHHSQRELVKKLTPRDLADVARAVSEAEKRQQRIYTRKAVDGNK
jgi:hypothetical protein